jgi:RNA polymerase sigma-70 factor (ECF subfamily)
MPASPEDWVAVLDRLLRGDRLAFLEVNRLVTGYLQQLRAWDFRDEWDDLRQEVLLSIVASARAGRLRDAQAFLAYTRAITRNKFVDRLKRRLRCKEKETLPWDEQTARALEARTDESGSAELRAAVQSLPLDQQRVLDGIYTQGKTYQEVSDDTGIPLGTMKRRLRDAILALRHRFADA